MFKNNYKFMLMSMQCIKMKFVVTTTERKEPNCAVAYLHIIKVKFILIQIGLL